MNTELLRLCHFSARIGQISYFSDFSFSVCAGEIHGLCGLSSAQRDILIRYFSGRKPAASGQLFAFGKPYTPASGEMFPPGIFCIQRNSSLIHRMTVTENLFVIRSAPGYPVFIRRRALGARCQELLERFGLSMDASTPVGELSPFGRIAVELLKAVVGGARVIFYDRGLDELSDYEFSRLHTLLRSITAAGMAVVPLCGQPARMLQLSARITTVKNGMSIKTFVSAEAMAQQIRQATLGTYEMPSLHTAFEAPCPLLSVKGLRLSEKDAPLDLTLSQGEIVGLVNASPSSADRILQALYGLLPCSCYHLSVCGNSLPTRKPALAFDYGMLLVQNIECNDAMLYTASLRTNVELPLLRRSASFGGRIRRKFLDGEVERAAKAVGISPGQLGEPLAPPLILRAQLMRILLSHRPVLLLENPFVGLSPADDHLLRRFLVHFARDGNCVLFTSAHFSEMSEICTHCYQLTDGLLPVQSTAPEGRRLG